MDTLELIVHKVNHGAAISLVERPSDYVTHIDLGGGDGDSPLERLYDRQRLTVDLLLITHPHPDRLADIAAARSEFLRPAMVQHIDYDWDAVTAGMSEAEKPLIEQFRKLSADLPDGDYRGEGTCWWKHWKLNFAAEVFGKNSVLDNAGMLVVYGWRDFKIVIAADQEAKALEHLLDDKEIIARAYRPDILVAPRYGDETGFTRKWTEVLGKPYFTIIPSAGGKTAYPGYNSPEFARGVTIGEERHYCLSTQENSSIIVKMSYTADGKPTWAFRFEQVS